MKKIYLVNMCFLSSFFLYSQRNPFVFVDESIQVTLDAPIAEKNCPSTLDQEAQWQVVQQTDQAIVVKNNEGATRTIVTPQ